MAVTIKLQYPGELISYAHLGQNYKLEDVWEDESVPLVSVETDYVVAVKQEGIEGRLLAMDFNPGMPRAKLLAKTPRNEDLFGYYRQTDFIFDRITGFGHQVNEGADFSIQNITETLSPDFNSNPYHLPEIPEAISQKYKNILDPEYVLGVIHPLGVTGGQLVSFNDYLDILIHADKYIKDQITYFLTDVRPHIPETSDEVMNAMAWMRFEMALVACGKKLSEEESTKYWECFHKIWNEEFTTYIGPDEFNFTFNGFEISLYYPLISTLPSYP